MIFSETDDVSKAMIETHKTGLCRNYNNAKDWKGERTNDAQRWKLLLTLKI
jgi:hypothetical protein